MPDSSLGSFDACMRQKRTERCGLRIGKKRKALVTLQRLICIASNVLSPAVPLVADIHTFLYPLLPQLSSLPNIVLHGKISSAHSLRYAMGPYLYFG